MRDVLRRELDGDLLAGIDSDLARREAERGGDDTDRAGAIGYRVGCRRSALVHVLVAHAHAHVHAPAPTAASAGREPGGSREQRRGDD
ncbi:MAG: hypothetical protein M5T61_02040 [Acidimicrobiia bacterium]|nr:hypothetical protein [Acidimicrobiia bacterium]